MDQNLSELTANEMIVLESLHGAESGISQREIACRTGLSLGLINAVIKRLVTTGYVKTSHLNRRSLDYLLTPQGFAHTAIRSYNYVLNTVRSYRSMHRRLENILDRLSSEGVSTFYLHGDGELSELVAMFFERDRWGSLKRGMPFRCGDGAVVLNTSPTPIDNAKFRVVNLVQELGDERHDRGPAKTREFS